MKYFIVFIFALFSQSAISQQILEWRSHTSFRNIIGIEEDSLSRIWAITEGGIAVYEDEILIKKLTPLDGLSRLNGTSILYDQTSAKVFVGYVDGIIDVIDINDFKIDRLEDINRSSVFTSKSINELIVIDESMLVGTDFGIVEYSTSNFLVRNTFLKLGDFDSGSKINDLLVVGDSLYVATNQGTAYTAVDGNYSTEDWKNYDENSGLGSSSILHLGYSDNVLYASSEDMNYKLESGSVNWTTNDEFTNNIIIGYAEIDNIFIALAERNIFKKIEGGFDARFLSENIGTSLIKTKNQTFAFGTLNGGLAIFNQLDLSYKLITGEGPYTNFFDGLNFDNGTLIASSSNKSSGNGNIDKAKGFYVLKDGNWTNFNSVLHSELSNLDFQQAFTSTVTNEYYYFGSWGRGVSRLNKETSEIKVFDETNSTLRGWPADDPNFPVITGIQTDNSDDVWLVSRYGGNPLYRQTPGDEDWQAFEENNAVSTSDLYEDLFIDSYDQKWISLHNAQSSGTGLLVLDTKDPENNDDDIGVKLQTGASNGNLPDNKVNALIEDKNGEVWIGTSRGIAKFIFPELIIEGSSQERAAQWLINEDTSAVSRFLLRDINVSAMAVNDANEKWIGSANQGLYLLNSEGSRIIKRFTTENSPLFSNNIKSIAVNDITGEVFIATEGGLISYQDIPKKPVTEMKELKVFPNPFNYDKNDQVIIEGLSDETKVKVLGVDGTVLNSFSTNGGRVSWNGRDSSGNKLGSGIYYVVAVDSEGSSKGVGKVVIVR
ncbi:MAG: hypothetical protein JJ892_12975 [Balneola sp.]|nr:hypothetical protein [Balneola sp.]MBO6651678.1 hypothetical protein [Balneola sp.]MBO6712884.1 hypothetical protein [Balneola sp.]MBO6801183.1 hypothetical protein [Balneola sp.]MBO6871375.1 hypothetical protein [Balneola sp.]